MVELSACMLLLCQPTVRTRKVWQGGVADVSHSCALWSQPPSSPPQPCSPLLMRLADNACCDCMSASPTEGEVLDVCTCATPMVEPDPPLHSHRSKAKNAQEAHEAIRPTDAAREPGSLGVPDARLARVYDLIWRRTLACQMAAARIRQVSVYADASSYTDRWTRRCTQVHPPPGTLAWQEVHV